MGQKQKMEFEQSATHKEVFKFVCVCESREYIYVPKDDSHTGLEHAMSK